MSVGASKVWKVFRNQLSASGKQRKQAEDLKERFGHYNALKERMRQYVQLRNAEIERIKLIPDLSHEDRVKALMTWYDAHPFSAKR